MRNISIHPWDRPMWTDSPTPLHEQFGMTAMEARLGRWCFNGDGDAGDDGAVDDVEREGDIDPDTDLQGRSNKDDPESNQAAADRADAAAAAGITDDFDALSTDAPGLTAEQAEASFSAVGDLDSYSSRDAAQAATDIAAASVSGNVADLSGFDTAAVDEAVNQLNEVGEVSIGYNDLAGFKDEDGFGLEFGPKQESYFDRKEDDIQRADRDIAKAIQEKAKAQGRDVNVSVDAQGQFSYTPGPTGTLTDVAAVAGSQVAQGLSTVGSIATPSGLAMSALNPDLFDLGLDLAPKDLAGRATQAALSERQGTFDRGQGAGPAVMGQADDLDLGLATVTQADARNREDFDPNRAGFFDPIEEIDVAGQIQIDPEAQQDLVNEMAREQDLMSARSFEKASGNLDPIAMVGIDRYSLGEFTPNAQTAAEAAVGPGSDIQYAQLPNDLLAEDVDLLGSLIEEQGSEQTPVVVKPEEEKTPTDPIEEITPRPFEILPFAASTPFTPSTQFGQVVPFTRNLEYTRPGGIADLQQQLAILNRRLFT